jgi:hypothetical protein
MSNLGKLPNDSDLRFDPRSGPPSLDALVRHEPRGAVVDQGAAIAKSALDMPALPGTSEVKERGAYRQKLVATNRALDGAQFNTTARGAVSGLVVAAGFVLRGVQGAVVVGLTIVAWKAIKFLGRRQ